MPTKLAASPFRRVHVSTVVLCVASTSLNNAACTRPGLVMEGRVVDAQHRPVSAAKVIVVNSTEGHVAYMNPRWIDYGKDPTSYDNETFSLLPVSGHNGRYSARTQTGRDGRFRIAGLGADTYHLLTVHPERGLNAVGNVELPGADPPPWKSNCLSRHF